MHFVGADIRNSAYLRWLNKHFFDYLHGKAGENCPPKQTPHQRRLVNLSEKKAHLIFVSSPDLLEFFSVKEKVHFIPVFIDEKKFLEELTFAPQISFEEKKFRILFAPSNSPIKGADYVVSSVQRWAEDKPDVEFLNMLEDKWKKHAKPFSPYVLTHLDLLAYMKAVDVVIDQVLIGWYGLQAVESIYLNKFTICYISKDLKKYLFPGCPILSFDKDIREALDRAYILAKANMHNDFRSFVEQYHTIEKSAFFDLVKKIILS